MRKSRMLLLVLLCLIVATGSAWVRMDALQKEAAKALKQAMASLNNPTDTANLVCLTNAGYAMVQGGFIHRKGHFG